MVTGPDYPRLIFVITHDVHINLCETSLRKDNAECSLLDLIGFDYVYQKDIIKV